MVIDGYFYNVLAQYKYNGNPPPQPFKTFFFSGPWNPKILNHCYRKNCLKGNYFLWSQRGVYSILNEGPGCKALTGEQIRSMLVYLRVPRSSLCSVHKDPWGSRQYADPDSAGPAQSKILDCQQTPTQCSKGRVAKLVSSEPDRPGSAPASIHSSCDPCASYLTCLP